MTNSVRIKQEMLDSNPEDSGSEQVLDLRKSSTQIERSCTWCGKQNDPQNQGVHKDFCSEICFDLFRRDSFKKRASCVWCGSSASAQSLLTLNGATVDESKFCSPQCLTQFKVRVFCEETSAHLSLDQLKEVTKEKGKSSNSSSKDLITPELWLKHSTSTSKPNLTTTTIGLGSGSRTTPNSSSSTNSDGSTSSSNCNLPSNGNSILATLSRSLQSSSSSSGSGSRSNNTGGSGSASTAKVIVSTPTSSPLFFSPVSNTITASTTTPSSSSSSSAATTTTGPPPRKRGRIPVSTGSHQSLRSPVSSEYFPVNLAGVCFNPNSHPSPSSISNREQRDHHHHPQQQHHHRESSTSLSSSRSSIRRGNSHHNNSRVSMSRQLPNPNIVSSSFSIPRMMNNPNPFSLTGFPFPPHLTHHPQHHPHNQHHQQQHPQQQQMFPTTKSEMGVNTRISFEDDKEFFLSDDMSINSTNDSHAVLWSSSRKKKSPVFKNTSTTKEEEGEEEGVEDEDSHMNEKSGNNHVQENYNDNDIEKRKWCGKNKLVNKMLEKNQSSKTIDASSCVSCKLDHHQHFPSYPSIIPIPIPIPIPIFIPFPINLSSGNSRKTSPSPIVSTPNTNSFTIQPMEQNAENHEEDQVIDSPSPIANNTSNINNNNNNNNNNCANHENSENNDQIKLKRGHIIQDMEEND